MQYQRGLQPQVRLAAIDPKAGVSGGLLFAAWLVLGNGINAGMEEGLVRGVLIPLFGRSMPLSGANGLQALLGPVQGGEYGTMYMEKYWGARDAMRQEIWKGAT